MTDEIKDKEVRQATIQDFLKELKELQDIDEFQPALWYSLSDYMMIYSKDDVWITFKDGNKIRS